MNHLHTELNVSICEEMLPHNLRHAFNNMRGEEKWGYVQRMKLIAKHIGTNVDR